MARKKTILILLSFNDWRREQPKLGGGLRKAYTVWDYVAKKHNVKLLRGTYDWFKKDRFIKYWEQEKAHIWRKVNKSIKPDFIYDKAGTHDIKTGEKIPRKMALKHAISEVFPMVNLPEFTELVDNKLSQAVVFNDYMPETKIWMPGSTIKNPQGKTIVAKSLGGSGGSYVFITRSKRIPVKYPMVQQKFVEATRGGDLRDIRIAFIGDKPQYVYNRIALPGSLYTNVHKGASMEFMKLSDIPHLLKLIRKMSEPLKIFSKRILSFDFLVDAKTGQPYLIEVNPMPGTEMFPEGLLERYLTDLTVHITS